MNHVYIFEREDGREGGKEGSHWGGNGRYKTMRQWKCRRKIRGECRRYFPQRPVNLLLFCSRRKADTLLHRFAKIPPNWPRSWRTRAFITTINILFHFFSQINVCPFHRQLGDVCWKSKKIVHIMKVINGSFSKKFINWQPMNHDWDPVMMVCGQYGICYKGLGGWGQRLTP